MIPYNPQPETRNSKPADKGGLMDPMALMIAWFIIITNVESWVVAVLSTVAFMVLSTLQPAL